MVLSADFKGFGARPNPPVCNTGVTIPHPPVQTLIDWVRCTFPVAHLNHILYLAKDFFGELPELEYAADGSPRGTHNFRYLYTTVSGIRVEHSNHQKPEDSPDQQGSFQVPGSVLSGLSLEDLSDFLALLSHYATRFTRIDLAVDDYARNVSLSEVESAARRGDMTGFRVWEPRTGSLAAGCGPSAGFQTVAFGKRGKMGSGKYVRIYDKGIQSGGAKDCIRIEAEYHKFRADEVARSLAAAEPCQYHRLILGWLKGTISFIDRKVAECPKDCPLLPWWAAIFSNVDRVCFRPKVVVRSFEKSLEWLETQVAPTFEMVVRCLSLAQEGAIYDFLDRLQTIGSCRLSYHHRRMIDAYSSQLSCKRLQAA